MTDRLDQQLDTLGPVTPDPGPPPSALLTALSLRRRRNRTRRAVALCTVAAVTLTTYLLIPSPTSPPLIPTPVTKTDNNLHHAPTRPPGSHTPFTLAALSRLNPSLDVNEFPGRPQPHSATPTPVLRPIDALLLLAEF